MSKFGGGGTKCAICDKTSYPAESISYEKVIYHANCFRCSKCDVKLQNTSKANKYEETLYCHSCFAAGGFAQKQRNVKWTKSSDTGSAVASKFGGGGNKCTVCEKTVYMAEQVSFEKKPYHADCFKCTIEGCNKKCTPSSAASYEGNIICTKCFTEKGYNQKQAKQGKSGGGATNALASKFGGGGTKCTVCDKTVYQAEQVSFEKKIYHSACMLCTVDGCGKKLSPSNSNLFEDKLICNQCFGAGGYRQKQAKTASTGSKTSNALASKFGGGGAKCVICTKTVYPAETVSYEKKIFHSDCFKCKNCSKKLNTSGAEGQKQDDGSVDVYCKKCWGELGLNRAKVN